MKILSADSRVNSIILHKVSSSRVDLMHQVVFFHWSVLSSVNINKRAFFSMRHKEIILIIVWNGLRTE